MEWTFSESNSIETYQIVQASNQSHRYKFLGYPVLTPPMMFGADELSQGLCAPRKTGQSGPMFFRIPPKKVSGQLSEVGSPQAFRSFRKVYMEGTFGNPRFGSKA